jgi:ornithine cyclodeaminase
MNGREILVLREAEIRSLLTPQLCLAAVEQAFTAYATGQAELPSVIGLRVPDHQGEVHVKAGYLHNGPYYAVKFASGFPQNASLGLATNGGFVAVFDATTGVIAALLLDNGYITDLRTGAAGALAAKYLAKATIARVAVIGTGGQARYQVQCLGLVRRFQEVRVWGRNLQRAEECAADIARENAGVNCAAAASVREAVSDADVVITVTASRKPLVRADWIQKGATIIAVGSDDPEKQELDVDVVGRADRIVADSLPQCIRLGEIHHAIEKGVVGKESVTCELGEITAGRKPGRSTDEEIIVCDLTGVGVQDVAAASVVLQRAREAGVGERLAL